MENISSDWQGFLFAALSQLLFRLPIIAVYIVGIVLSFTKSQKHPKISSLSGIGFGILLILSILSVFITLLPVYFAGQKYSTQSISYILSGIGLITTIISTIATALLLRAIWKDRA